MNTNLPADSALLRLAVAILMGVCVFTLSIPAGRAQSRNRSLAVGSIASSDIVTSESKRVDAIDNLDALTATSDFTIFMRPGVPDDVRVCALRKLWTSDPVFNEVGPHE
jgi:hypothetical protein